MSHSIRKQWTRASSNLEFINIADRDPYMTYFFKPYSVYENADHELDHYSCKQESSPAQKSTEPPPQNMSDKLLANFKYTVLHLSAHPSASNSLSRSLPWLTCLTQLVSLIRSVSPGTTRFAWGRWKLGGALGCVHMMWRPECVCKLT